MPAQKKATATKSAPAAAPERAKILSRADRLAAKSSAEAAAVEARRAAKRAAAARWYAKKKAARAAAQQPATVLPVAAPAQQAVQPAQAERVSKAQIVSTLEVLLASNRKKLRGKSDVRDVAFLSGVSEGLQTALSLVADLLAE